MVLEHVLDSKRVLDHPLFIPLISFGYTLLALGIVALFFTGVEGIALVFCVTLMITPSLMHVMRIEEKIESKVGLKHFLKSHNLSFEVYGLAFIGLLVGFLFVAFYFPSALDYQHYLLNSQGSLTLEMSSYDPVSAVMGVFTHNLLVALACVVLSLFYGAGAVFLIVLNASVFARFIAWVIQTASSIQVGLAVFIHLLPELVGFLLAAMSGATLSWVFLDQRFGSKAFANVIKNSLALLLVAVLFILAGALLEVYVSAPILAGLTS